VPTPQTITPRSLASIALLERLQQRESGRSGLRRDPASDQRVLQEIAERQLMAERLDCAGAASVDDYARRLVDMVAEPDYQTQIAARVAALSAYFVESDGDLWSTFERPDHRRRLSDLVVRVETAAAARGYAIVRRPTIGTLLTGDVNAQARPGPPGEGHLVVFDNGLLVFASVIAGIAVQAIDGRVSADGTSITFRGPEGIGAHVATRPGVLLQFADLAFSSAVLGTCLFSQTVPMPPEYRGLADLLTDALLTFVLAHEYGHVILGHTDLPQRREQQQEPHQLEFAADCVGFELAAAAPDVSHWAYVGASLFMSGVDVLTRAALLFRTGSDDGPPSVTHPPPADRASRLEALVPGCVSAAMAPHVSRMAAAIDFALQQMWRFARPAFAAGHAEGVPPAGYRPADEYEKQAALQSFMSAGFGGGRHT
jgi:hypothetical protein